MCQCRSMLLGFMLTLSGCQSLPPKADLVFLSGHIITQDSSNPLVSALAIKNGKIIATGNDEQIIRWQDSHTRVVNLAGQTLLPGLIDSHVHSIEGAMALDACSMNDEKLSMVELAKRINQCAVKQAGSDWLQILNVRSVGLPINRHDLDNILPERPLFLVSTDGHTAWANTRALHLAGVNGQTLAPANGDIGHESDGEPDGVLQDGATALVSKVIPQMPLQQRVSAMERVLQRFYAAGITAFLEANSNQASVETFCALAGKGKLAAHVSMALGSEGIASDEEFSRLLNLKLQASECGVLADTIKLYADGVMEYPIQTAALLQPYLNENKQENQNSGALYQPLEPLKKFTVEALQSGFGIHVHSIGDAATRTVLDAFEHARLQAPQAKGRLSLAHLQLIDPADYGRFAQLNVIASLQLLWAQPDEYSVDAVLPYLGTARHSRLYPAASLVAAGATIAGGSDWNVSSFNPFEAMAVAVSRMNPDYPQLGTLNQQEALPLRVILQAYTHNAAKILGRDKQIGQLKAGMQADLIVLDRHLSDDVSPAKLAGSKVQLTLINGQVVFGQLNL